jgi:hypothetical protein
LAVLVAAGHWFESNPGHKYESRYSSGFLLNILIGHRTKARFSLIYVGYLPENEQELFNITTSWKFVFLCRNGEEKI